MIRIHPRVRTKGLTRMKYFIGVGSSGNASRGQIWKVDQALAERIDVAPSALNFLAADPGEEALTTLRKKYSAFDFQPSEFEPGQYYPCMARPTTETLKDSPGRYPIKSDEILHERARSTGQLHALIGQLEDICRVVQPEKANLNAYGHEIRNVLLLACTEVEAHCKKILSENGKEKKYQTTEDYVALAGPMRLSEYVVSFSYYPWLEPVKPFEHWTKNKATQSLEWYSAYNLVKHDRGKEFQHASLLHAFEAITACFVLLCAQHGWDFAMRGEQGDRAFLKLIGAPTWPVGEAYVPPYRCEWQAKNYPFGD